MKTLFTVLVPSDGSTQTVDGVSWQEKLWLVPQWFDYPKENASKPARMIRFDNLPHYQSTATPHDYVLNQHMPIAVLEGKSDGGFEILSGSAITFGIRRGQSH